MTQTATDRNLAPADTSSVAPSGHGRIVERRDDLVVFRPRGTNYELHLLAPNFTGNIDKPVRGIVRVQARKLYTVPSGGAFVAPIMGTPRIVQGRVIDIEPPAEGFAGRITLQAGAVVVADLPAEAHAIDLGNGPVEVGAMVNVVAQPGASFEPAKGD